MTMVAVGGSIGTGLLLGSGAAIEIAGPAVILSFIAAAFISWTLAVAIGELATVHPGPGSFGLYGEIYLNQWAGFISRAGYWIAISISVGSELVASAIYMGYWFPHVPAVLWVLSFSALLLIVNTWEVGSYGRFEYWFAMIKVVTILGFVGVGALLLLSGRMPAQYTAQGGFMAKGWLAPLIAMPFALYTFAGVEFVAVTTGESRSAADIPRAVRWTFQLLTVVYLSAITILAGVVSSRAAGVTDSPFVTVFGRAGFPATPHVMNFVVLTAALSGANAALYISSRMLFSLAQRGWAPSPLGRLNRAGSPRAAILVSSYAIFVALALETWAPADAFVTILTVALFGLLLSWLISLAAHISFRRRLSATEVAALPVRAGGGVWSSAIGFILVLVAISETCYQSRLTLYAGITYLVLLNIAYLLVRRKA